MYKKLITIICICFSAVLIQSMAYAEEYYSTYYSDTLQALGIEIDADSEDVITKGAFCGIVANLMDLNTEYSGQAIYFRDVTQDHEYYEEITILAEQGYVVGDDKGRFYPDEPLTSETASVILVRCLGYELNAQYGGGWISGYYRIANELGINDGVGSVSNTGLTGPQVTRMVFNTLLAPTYGMNLSEQMIEKGETLAEKIYFAVELEGVVKQTRFTGIDTIEGCPQGMVVLDETAVYTGETNAESYLGYKIRAMAIENEDDSYTLISVAKHKQNTDLRISYNEINEVPDIYSIEYEQADSNRIRTINLDRNVSVIYNYQKLMAYETADLQIENGYMQLVDNNNDGKYDVVLVYEYLTYFVAGVDTDAGFIYDKYGYDALDVNEDTIILNSYDYEVDLSTIKTDSVLSVYMPKTANASSYTVIVVSDYEPVEGKVTGVLNEREMTVTINGENYIIDKRYLSVSQTNPQVTKIELGVSGIFYLNKDKQISGFKYTTSDELYGYMKKIYIDEVDEKAYFELFSQEAVFVKGQISEKVKLNGARIRNTEALLEDGILFPEGKFKPQLVKFKLDGDGKMTSLKIASEAVATNPMQTDEEELTYNGTVTDGEMRPSGQKYAYKYLYTDDTIVFNVPAANDISNERKYSISEKVYTDGEDLTLKLYDVGFDYIIGAAVQVDGANSVNFDNQQSLTIITDICQVYDEETQEVCMALTGITDGEEQTYTCTLEDGYFDGFKIGDFARILVNKTTGETIGALKVFTFSDAGPTADTDAVIYHDRYARKNPNRKNPIPNGDYDYGITSVYGRCIAKGENSIALTLDGGASGYASNINKNAGYYLVEYQGGRVRVTKVTADAIVASSSPKAVNGHNVMLNIRNAMTTEVFIIKEDA